MQNFEYYNPTRLIFGRGEIASLTRHIPEGVRVLVTFGGGSVKRNGVYDQVKAALAGIDHVEFWGIEANPKVETLRKCIEFGREQKAGFILAVGGGSVLDGSKLVACALTEGRNARRLGHRPLPPSRPLHSLRERHDAPGHGLRNERQQRHLPP